jgi:Heavy-metal-associated domain.
LKEIKLYVNGIMCPNCVSKITAALAEEDGCDSAFVSDDYSTVNVQFQENRITVDQIINKIESIQGKSFHVAKQEEVIK